jgi:hypothetical protein
MTSPENQTPSTTKKMTPESLSGWSDFWGFVTVALTLGVGVTGVLAWRFATWSSDANATALQKYKSDAAVALGQANAKAEEAHNNAAQAIARAAQTQLEAEQLKAFLAWRTIDKQMGDALVHLLSATPGSVRIDFVENDPESTFVAIQLEKVFNDAKWKTRLWGCQFSGGLVWGVFVPANTSHPDTVAKVQAAFGSVGLAFSTDDPPQSSVSFTGGNLTLGFQPLAPDEILVFIGSKRPPI